MYEINGNLSVYNKDTSKLKIIYWYDSNDNVIINVYSKYIKNTLKYLYEKAK